MNIRKALIQMKLLNWKTNKISKLCLGTVQFGLNYGIANVSGQVQQNEVNNILNFVVNEGINCFDTAKAYGNSEEIIGNFNKETDYQGISIISKIKSDYLTDYVSAEIRDLLKKLSINTLFGLLLHDSKILYKWSFKEDNLIKLLKHDKLIRHFGISIYTDEEFLLALENDNIEIIQIPFNLFDQRAITKSWFKKAKDANKLIFIRSIFLQGLFFMDVDRLKGNLAGATPYLEEMHSMRTKLNLSIAEFAMAYVDSVASDAVILFGCDTLDQAKENTSSYNNLPTINEDILGIINSKFTDIPEYIANPTNWSL